MTKEEDWVAKKELRKEEHHFDMAAWLHKYQPLLPHFPDGQRTFAHVLLDWLTFEGLFPTSEKTPRQRHRAEDKLKQQRRQQLMHDPLRTQSSRTSRPGWGSCYACLLTVHSGRSQ